jgi:hypothetical protein
MKAKSKRKKPNLKVEVEENHQLQEVKGDVEAGKQVEARRQLKVLKMKCPRKKLNQRVGEEAEVKDQPMKRLGLRRLVEEARKRSD